MWRRLQGGPALSGEGGARIHGVAQAVGWYIHWEDGSGASNDYFGELVEDSFHAIGHLGGFSACAGVVWARSTWPPGLCCKVELAEDAGVDYSLHEVGRDAPDCVAEGAEGIGNN